MTPLRWLPPVILCVLAPAAGGQGSTARQFLASLDRNHDDHVSRAEWKGTGSTFLAMDVDRDGYLTQAELAHAGKASEPVAVPDDPAAADRIAVSIRELRDPPEAFAQRCFACHDERRILQAAKTRDGWNDTVRRMKEKEEAAITEKESKVISSWLEKLRAEAAELARSFGSSDPAADWALVLGGGDLHLFDRDRNGRLDGSELNRLVFDRADVDRGGALSPGEFALLPLAADHASAFRKLDRDRSGTLSPKELGPPMALIQLADTNDDAMLARAEIPRARQVGGPYPMILAVDAARALQILDRDRDGRLSSKELERFPGTLARFDEDRDSSLDKVELETAVTAARAEGPYAAFDDFFTRYDLDGDGSVSALEYPGTPAFYRRLDENGDGKISPKEAPAGWRQTDFTPEALRWRE